MFVTTVDENLEDPDVFYADERVVAKGGLPGEMVTVRVQVPTPVNIDVIQIPQLARILDLGMTHLLPGVGTIGVRRSAGEQ